MKKMMKLIGVALLFSMFTSCSLVDELIEDETPTKTKMQGVWEVVEVKEIGTDTLDILNTLNPKIPSFIHIKENTHFSSTAGPLFLYIVYGRSKWTQIMSKVDQFFDYAKLTTTDGRWFSGGGVVETFTPQVTLSFPSSSAAKSFLELFGVGNGYFDTYIEHKFKDVSISFTNDDTMYWEWTESTVGEYNKMTDEGDLLLWHGWEADKYSRCRLKLVKRVGTLTELITSATKN